LIRRATPEDIPALVELGKKFHAASPYAHLPYVPERVASTVAHILEAGCVMVSDVDGVRGMSAAMAGPMWFSDVPAAQELFWWSDGSGEAHELRAALEAWARDQGCALFVMVCLENEKAPVLARLYRRDGYQPVEHHFIRRL